MLGTQRFTTAKVWKWSGAALCACALAGCAGPKKQPTIQTPAVVAPPPAIPLITNVDKAAPIPLELARPSGDFDAKRVEAVAAAAAAQAVVELKCAPKQFEARAVPIGKRLNTLARKEGGEAAARYAKDSAVDSYKKLAKHNAGLGCSAMGPLRKVAQAEGFGVAKASKPVKKSKKASAKTKKKAQ